MKLFQIREVASNKVLNPTYPSKPSAKNARDLLEGPREELNPRRFVIVPGPDHHKYNGTT